MCLFVLLSSIKGKQIIIIVYKKKDVMVSPITSFILRQSMLVLEFCAEELAVETGDM